MCIRSSLLRPSLLFVFSSFALAQSDEPPPGQVQSVQMRDGGTRQILESIFIPPKPNAPFSLVLATEWSRPMVTGGTFTLANHRRVMRDSKGRIYEERWLLVPKDSKVQSEMNYIQVADPAMHTEYDCSVRKKICYLLNYTDSTATDYRPAIGTSGPLPAGAGFRTHEDLGVSSVSGVDTHGYRESVTINPGVMGNDQPMISSREFWYSPQLGINLLSKLEDPHSGKQVFKVAELSLSEPEPQFFEVPPGYKILDQRNGTQQAPE